MPPPKANNDIIIPILGITGAGKSTFINTAIGKPVAAVGHELHSCTSRIEQFSVPHPRDRNRRVVFVDTPGFDDTYIDDEEILRLVTIWLARSYYDGMKIAGIIYLHEISQPRFETSRTSFFMLKKLCGDDRLKNIILATTKWGNIDEAVGRRREQQLSETYWKRMLLRGSRMARFMDTRESAWAIIDLVLDGDSVNLPKHSSQLEMVKYRPLSPTRRCKGLFGFLFG